MRTLVRRASAAIGGAALLLVALPAVPASATTSLSCPAASSTRILTAGVGGGGDNKLWVYQPTTSQTIICFDFYPTASLAAGAVVLNTGSSITLPGATVGTDPTACTTEVVRITDPVPFRLALGASGTTVCFTVNSSTTSLRVTLGSVGTIPSVELWSDPSFTWQDVALCAALTGSVQYACEHTEYRQI